MGKKLHTAPSELTSMIQPQATEMEEVVLGAMLLEKEAVFNVIDILQPDSFYNEHHGTVYSAMVRLHKAGHPIDILTVTKEVKAMNKLESIGGAYFISKLTDRIASSANIEFHARVIQQNFILREIIRESTYSIRKAYENGTDAFELQEELIAKVQNITNGISKNKLKSIEQIKDTIIDNLNQTVNSEKIVGITSGIKAFDDHTGGFQNSKLYIIAARPGMGKTSVALCFGMAAAKAGFPVGIFSHEMNDEELVSKALSSESGVPSQKIINRTVSNSEIDKIWINGKNFNGMPLYIDDTPEMSIAQVKSAGRKMKREKGIKMLIIDYLQLQTGSGEYKGNREAEISNISRGLKILSRELEIPVIALSQLSREVDKRPNKEPVLSDLRESGAIEQDADMVIFPYRPQYYSEDTTEMYSIGKNSYSIAGLMVFIIAKYRGGSLGKIKARWISYLTKIEDYDKAEQVIEPAQKDLPF